MQPINAVITAGHGYAEVVSSANDGLDRGHDTQSPFSFRALQDKVQILPAS